MFYRQFILSTFHATKFFPMPHAAQRIFSSAFSALLTFRVMRQHLSGAGNSLICSSLIRSFRENQMSVSQDKWATVSHLRRSLRGNERTSDSLKTIWLKKSKILFLVCFIYDLKKKKMKKWANRSFPLFGWWAMLVNRSGHSPKMSNVSESIRSLTKNERPWAIRSGHSEEMSD